MISSEGVREELAHIAPTRRCDRLAELSALFHAAGSLHLRARRQWALHVDIASGAAARRAFALLREEGIRSEIRTYRQRSFSAGTRYQLHVAGEPEALAVLVAAGIVDRRHAPLDRPPSRVVSKACCRGSYLRGAFLGSGSLSTRRAPHLELRVATPGAAEFLRDLAGAAGVRMGAIHRSSHSAAYAKSWDAIETFLAVTGAAEMVLLLEERAVVATTRADANRRANADHANLVRTSRTAEAQLTAIATLRTQRRLDRLPPELQEAAELRTRHPTGSLRDLAARADPQVSRAAMHRRLGRLVELARE